MYVVFWHIEKCTTKGLAHNQLFWSEIYQPTIKKYGGSNMIKEDRQEQKGNLKKKKRDESDSCYQS